jgi:hypothetical protein
MIVVKRVRLRHDVDHDKFTGFAGVFKCEVHGNFPAHGVTENDWLIELMFVDEFLQVFCQQFVVVPVCVWRLAMVALVDREDAILRCKEL